MFFRGLKRLTGDLLGNIYSSPRGGWRLTRNLLGTMFTAGRKERRTISGDVEQGGVNTFRV